MINVLQILQELTPTQPIRPKDLYRLAGKLKVSESGCFEWQGFIHPSGYPYTSYRGKIVRANRLFYMLFNGNLTAGLYVCHKCDNCKCCNPKHLFLGTAKENMKDCEVKGRHTNIFKEGNKPANSKLDEKIAGKVIMMILDNPTMSVSKIAAKYKVPVSIVKDIKRGRAYNNLIEVVGEGLNPKTTIPELLGLCVKTA